MAKAIIDLGDSTSALGLTIADITFDWCLQVSDNAAVSTAAATLTERGYGIYILDVTVIEYTDFRLHVTGDRSIYASGVLDNATTDTALQSTLLDVQTFVNTLSAHVGTVKEYLIESASEVSVGIGNIITGNYQSVQIADDTYLQIQEDNTDPALIGIQAEFTFSDTGHEETPAFVRILGRYQGGASHYMDVEAFNYDTTSWEHISINMDITSTSTDFLYEFPLSNKHADDKGNGEIKIRCTHDRNGTPLNSSHNFYIDKVSVYKYHLMTEDTIADQVWDEVLTSGHNVSDSASEILKTRVGSSVYTHMDHPDIMTVVHGTLIQGTTSDLETIDGHVIIQEIEGNKATPFIVDFEWSSLDHQENLLHFVGRYAGELTKQHNVKILVWNIDSTSWVNLTTDDHDIPISDINVTKHWHLTNIDSTASLDSFYGTSAPYSLKVRIDHVSPTNQKDHYLYVDMIGLGEVGNVYVIPDNEGISVIRQEVTEPTYGLSAINSNLQRALGLMHENIFIDNPEYDNNNNLVRARVRIYSESTSVGTNSNVLATYQITSDGNGPGRFNNWKQIEV